MHRYNEQTKKQRTDNTCLFYYANFSECPKGYFGKLCKDPCPYPQFGDFCQDVCTCKKNKCDNVKGCAQQMSTQTGKIYT